VFEKNKECLSLPYISFAKLMKCLSRPKQIDFNNYISDKQAYDVIDKKGSIEKEKVIKRAYYKDIFYEDTVLLIGGKMLSKKKSRELLVDQIEFVELKYLTINKGETNSHQAVDFGAVLYDDKILVFGGSIRQ
jgi:hypothetical protein